MHLYIVDTDSQSSELSSFLSHLIVLNEFWSHSFLRLAEHEVNCVGCETHHFA